MKRGTTALAIAIVATVLLSRPAHATSAFVDGFSPNETATELTPQWCWAASLREVLRYTGQFRSQKQIAVATYGALDEMSALSPLQLYKGLHRSLQKLGVHLMASDFVVGAPVSAALVAEMTDDHLMIAWYSNPREREHAVVIHRVEYDTTTNGPTIASVTFFDSWSGVGDRTVAASVFGSNTSAYFTVRSVGAMREVQQWSEWLRANSCPFYAHDGVCDEPDPCAPGTDTDDCTAAARRAYNEPPPAARPYCCNLYGVPVCPVSRDGPPQGSRCACGGAGRGYTCWSR
jgi:hypothetical protein